MSAPLLGHRYNRFLDEAIADGAARTDDRPDYPPISSDERRVCDTVAEALFVSKSAVQWMFYNRQRGDKNAGRRILSILSSGRLKMTVKG